MSLGSEIQKDTYDAVNDSGAGVLIVISRESAGAYNPATGSNGVGVTTNQNALAIVSPASGGTVQAFDVRFDSGTLIESNLRSLMVPAFGLAFIPMPMDGVSSLESSSWSVLGVTPQSASGVPIYYSMTVRK